MNTLLYIMCIQKQRFFTMYLSLPHTHYTCISHSVLYTIPHTLSIINRAHRICFTTKNARYENEILFPHYLHYFTFMSEMHTFFSCTDT